MSGETDKRKESSMPPKLKIAMLVVGTRGDVQPFLAVAMRLQEHGHYVRLATHARFRDFVKSAGIDFYPLGGDPLVMVEFLVRNKHIIAAPGDRVILLEQLKAIIDSVPLACTEPDPITGEPFTAQAIIANPPAYGRVHVAEALGASLHIFSPIPGTPTNAFPHLYMQIPLSAGYWLLDEPEKMMDIILEALKNTGQRGIIDRGWGDLGSTHRNIPENVFFVADYPHDWLFPQCSAVVHHGAAGTIATGLRAGCPTAVIPFCGDMFLWGKILHKKGLAPAPIPMSQLSVESLSEAITFMLQPKVKLRSMELGQLIQREDGVGAAVEAFHRHLETDISSPKPSLKKVDPSNPVHWLFTQVGRFLAPTGLKKNRNHFDNL
ncbi:PREDICTED: sterol 3-beta-glucosyltransferase UGT80B1-like [Erythranthe guttata]|uniref:sterol 3-beta-glucosyltransferase UGT80B1-like n=1 Tax=Erythranthe guttata TaxID=4155 RepID=UPI00064DA19F|nr:PREDICTED: sterol 3-beta-glucosyltransferase UGT80B1-like [Erythranthe guttata]|eukprot:XP_012838292.1 PREDICTED: sterol 3-beta-glucosyltransferase UGT80B1-like [Erythranthe guttata]